MISVTIGALVIPDYPVGGVGLWIPEDGLTRPSLTRDNVYASSLFTHGQVLTHSRLSHAQIPLSVLAKSASSAGLVTLMDSLDAAVSEFSYSVALTIDGQTHTYLADPADTAWGEVDSGMTKAFMARCTLTIPCYPVAS